MLCDLYFKDMLFEHSSEIIVTKLFVKFGMYFKLCVDENILYSRSDLNYTYANEVTISGVK